MVTLKVKRKVTDSVQNRKLLPGEKIEISVERLNDIRKTLGKNFDNFFELLEIKQEKQIKKKNK